MLFSQKWPEDVEPMRISFSMDGVKNMDELYTYTTEKGRWGEDIAIEHYCGDNYCKRVDQHSVCVVLDTLSIVSLRYFPGEYHL